MIKRSLALRYVCKKYSLKYKWTFFGDVGAIDTDERVLWVSLFQKHFYSVLYHEIGHLITYNRLDFKGKYKQALQLKPRLTYGSEADQDVFVRLEDEAKASKFCLRVLKGEDREFLKRCWYTYTGQVANHINEGELYKYVDTVAKYNKYFENNQ